MNKYEWKELIRKTKWASKKKRLTRKEVNDIADGVIAMNKLSPKEETFKVKQEPTSIKDILGRLGG